MQQKKEASTRNTKIKGNKQKESVCDKSDQSRNIKHNNDNFGDDDYDNDNDKV